MIDMKNNSAKLHGMETTSPTVRQFLSRIGSKGGKKSAQHPNRRELNTQAAIARWRKAAPKVKDPEK